MDDVLRSIHERVKILIDVIKDAHISISRSNYCNLNGDVTILENGSGRITESMSDVLELIRTKGPGGIKSNGLEYYSRELQDLATFIKTRFCKGDISRVTLHVFESNYNTESFPMHTDPADVLICMLEGSKTMEVDRDGVLETHHLTPNEILFIPMNAPHRALNHENNLMLSIGIERYTVEHIQREG